VHDRSVAISKTMKNRIRLPSTNRKNLETG
jgi:hypothetical protein